MESGECFWQELERDKGGCASMDCVPTGKHSDSVVSAAGPPLVDLTVYRSKLSREDACISDPESSNSTSDFDTLRRTVLQGILLATDLLLWNVGTEDPQLVRRVRRRLSLYSFKGL